MLAIMHMYFYLKSKKNIKDIFLTSFFLGLSDFVLEFNTEAEDRVYCLFVSENLLPWTKACWPVWGGVDFFELMFTP